MKLPKSFPPLSIIALFVIAALIFAGCEQLTEPTSIKPLVNLSGKWSGSTVTWTLMLNISEKNRIIAGSAKMSYQTSPRVDSFIVSGNHIHPDVSFFLLGQNDTWDTFDFAGSFLVDTLLIGKLTAQSYQTRFDIIFRKL